MAKHVYQNPAKQAESYNPSTVNVSIIHPRQVRDFYVGLERNEIPRGFIPRFHTKYTKADGCWLWQAGKFRRGYGMVNLGRFANGKQHTEYAHRVAYVLAKGDIPDGQVVMHSCDVVGCVNPAHLTLGTQADNLRDCREKGRMPSTRQRRKAA